MAKEHKKTNPKRKLSGLVVASSPLSMDSPIPYLPPEISTPRYCFCRSGTSSFFSGSGVPSPPVARVFTVEGFGTTDLRAGTSKRALGSVPDTRGQANARVDNNAVAISRAVGVYRRTSFCSAAPNPRS